ncbi:MAG: hypothetical protein AAFU68_13715 [Pseudomonadota bacterium]
MRCEPIGGLNELRAAFRTRRAQFGGRDGGGFVQIERFWGVLNWAGGVRDRAGVFLARCGIRFGRCAVE